MFCYVWSDLFTHVKCTFAKRVNIIIEQESIYSHKFAFQIQGFGDGGLLVITFGNSEAIKAAGH